MAKMNISKLTHAVKKGLGKEFSNLTYDEIKGIIKSKKLLGSSVDDATNAVRKTLNIEKDYEKLFSKGASIGTKGEQLIVPKNGKMHKSYNKMINNKGMSSEEAIENIIKNNNSKRTTLDPDAVFKREELINKNRKQAEKIRNNQTKREIQREIELNYNNGNLGEEIANAIEQGGGFVGKGPVFSPTARLKGHTPDIDNIVSTRELKKNMYDNKESYMKYIQGKKYDEAIEAFKKEDFNHPLLKQLTNEGIDLKQINVDNLQALRQETINKMSAKDMKMVDAMGYYKVPQKVTGVLGTAWLVNKMAATGGQQTNSQLYGQTPY